MTLTPEREAEIREMAMPSHRDLLAEIDRLRAQLLNRDFALDERGKEVAGLRAEVARLTQQMYEDTVPKSEANARIAAEQERTRVARAGAEKLAEALRRCYHYPFATEALRQHEALS